MIFTIDEIKKRVAPVADKYALKAVYFFGSYRRFVNVFYINAIHNIIRSAVNTASGVVQMLPNIGENTILYIQA